MAFASRSDLVKRANIRRLAQLATPTDCEVVDDAGLRLAIEDDDLAAYPDEDQVTLALALAAIDSALADADALILSFGIPADTQTPLLSRLATTIALYYLQGSERMKEDIAKAYDGAVDMLKNHAKGIVNLIPVVPSDPVVDLGIGVEIISNPSRYQNFATEDDGWLD